MILITKNNLKKSNFGTFLGPSITSNLKISTLIWADFEDLRLCLFTKHNHVLGVQFYPKSNFDHPKIETPQPI